MGFKGFWGSLIALGRLARLLFRGKIKGGGGKQSKRMIFFFALYYVLSCCDGSVGTEGVYDIGNVYF